VPPEHGHAWTEPTTAPHELSLYPWTTSHRMIGRERICRGKLGKRRIYWRASSICWICRDSRQHDEWSSGDREPDLGVVER
jgi:hypothetical protein